MPTAKELGVDYQMSIWAGIFAPKGVSREIVDKLAGALDKALDDPAVQKRLADLGGAVPAKDERTPGEIRRLREGRDRPLVADPQGGRRHQLSFQESVRGR